jgi:hypothetical protein
MAGYTVTLHAYNPTKEGYIPHAYVTLKAPGQPPVIVGYYPKEHVVTGPGTVRNDGITGADISGNRTQHPSAYNKTFEVSPAQFANMLGFVDKTAGDPGTYHLIGDSNKSNFFAVPGYQCTGFARDVLAAGDIKPSILGTSLSETVRAIPGMLKYEFDSVPENQVKPYRSALTDVQIAEKIESIKNHIARNDPEDPNFQKPAKSDRPELPIQPWNAVEAGDIDGSANLLASLGRKPILLADTGGSVSDAPSTLELVLAEQKQDEAARAAVWKATLEAKYGVDVSIVKMDDGTLVVVSKNNEPLGIVTVKNGEVSLNGFDATKTTVDVVANLSVEQIATTPPVTPILDPVLIVADNTNKTDTTPAVISTTTTLPNNNTSTLGTDDVVNPTTPVTAPTLNDLQNQALNDALAAAGLNLDGNNPITALPPVNGMVILANADGDIVGTVDVSNAGSGGTANIQINGQPPQVVDRLGNSFDLDTAATMGTATGVLGLGNTLLGLANWDNASDLSHVQTVVSIYNQINGLANLGMPNMGGVGSVLSFLSACDSGDAGGIVYSGLQMVDTLTSSAGNLGMISAINPNIIPGLGMILALTNIEDNPLALNYYEFDSILGNKYAGYILKMASKTYHLHKKPVNDDLFTLAA